MTQKAFGNKALGSTQVKEWLRQFKQARTLVESDEYSGKALHQLEPTDHC
jgi:hypothetical protein